MEWLAFGAVCLIWGSTFLAAKVALATTAPLWLAGTRFVAAGMILLGWAAWREPGAIRSLFQSGWMCLVAVLTVTITYGLLFWGTVPLPSGTVAVLNSGMIPIGSLTFAVPFGQERFTWAHALGAVCGLVGLTLMFAGQFSRTELWAAAAVLVGTLAYCLGGVLKREKLSTWPAIPVAGATALIGGSLLLVSSLVLEGGSAAHGWSFLATPSAAVAWLALVLLGSVIAFTLYLHLIEAWGASKAGAYAFVSPVVALACGMLFLGERLRLSDVAGSTLLLVGAAAFLPRSRAGKGRPDQG